MDVYTYIQGKGGTRERVKVDLGAGVSLNEAERNKAVDAKLSQGEYDFAPPTFSERIGGALSQAPGMAYEAAKEYGPSLYAIGRGATAGAARGAPLGPWGTLGGALGGAVIGGMAGRAATNVWNLGEHALTGAPVTAQPESPLETAYRGGMTGLESELGGRGIGLFIKPFRVQTLGEAGRTAMKAAGKEAIARGIDLDAAQMSGSPFLQSMRSAATRMGSRELRQFGEKQAGQVIKAGEEELGASIGPPLDLAARSNRFMELLQTRVSAIKQEGNDLFERYVQLAGERSPVSLQPLYKAAYEIAGDQGILRSIQNKRLMSILREIQTLKAQGFTELPLREIRKIQQGFGDIAFPSTVKGTVTVDAPVAAAQKLWGALKDSLTAQAAQSGRADTLAALEEANQFWGLAVAPMNDSRLFRALLAGDQSLGSTAKQLFNPRDTGLLLDAKAVLSDEGWKVLQQHYWDEVFNASVSVSKSGGAPAFNGAKFADQMARDKTVLTHLFTPKQQAGIEGFAQAARLVSSTTAPRDMEAFGAMFVAGRASVVGGSLMAAVSGHPGVAATGAMAATTPWIFGHLITNPTTAGLMANAFRGGRFDPETWNTILRWGIRSGAIGANKPALQEAK